MNSLDLTAMTKQEHSHTPYLVILYKFLEKWRAEHDGSLPKTYQGKREFKEMIEQGDGRSFKLAYNVVLTTINLFREAQEC